MSAVYFLIYDDTDVVDFYATLPELIAAADMADMDGLSVTLEVLM